MVAGRSVAPVARLVPGAGRPAPRRRPVNRESATPSAAAAAPPMPARLRRRPLTSGRRGLHGCVSRLPAGLLQEGRRTS